jgi:primosomal protein N' (replication factor Y) (superfamily II helicase)
MQKEYPLYAQVYVDIQARQLNKPFTYGVPESLSESLYIGAAVKVPFNRREILGYVVDVGEFPPAMPGGVKIKPVAEVIEGKSMWDREMVGLARWLENYYGSGFVSALKVLIPAPVRVDKEGRVPALSKIKKVALTCDPSGHLQNLEKKAPAQARIIRYLLTQQGAVPASEVVNKTEATYGALNSLQKKELINVFDDAPPSAVFKNHPLSTGTAFPLTDDQQKVFDRLINLHKSDKAEVALLHGITGSGKTEVYLQAIEQVLKDGTEAIVLVPEISLTPQAIERFRGRFKEDVAVLHSRLTDAERREMWWKIRNKGVRVVLGARSAVFAPLENIGVIVVDEEHESSYKQEKDPRYNARQVAVKRALNHNSLVILGSATPSFEVYHWAKQGKYHYLELPRRVGQSILPEIQIVDLKKDHAENNRGIIGETLKKEMERILSRDEQAILFLNRRGFSGFLLCKDCGNVIRCPYCAITLRITKPDVF